MSTLEPLLSSLHKRELGCKWEFPELSKASQRKIDSEYGNTPSFLQSLRESIATGDWNEIGVAVGDVILNLLDNTNANQLFNLTSKKKQQRECFVLNGGIKVLLQLFEPPFIPHRDARKLTTQEVKDHSETWNEIMVILREIAYAIPTLGERIFTTEQLVFFFTMLAHQALFDNTMNLLEEIMASREDTFQLSLVPDFYSLVGKFSSRQLAHFCRILSLVLFEPEDRHVMEGHHTLHSSELLQLRRNRMSRNCHGIVERNQSLVIDMPDLLERLVQILRIVNFGPNLADLISHNIAAQMPITSDVLQFFSSSLGVSDWDHFANLEQIVHDERRSPSTASSSPRTPPRTTTNVSNARRALGGDLSALDDEDITAELLSSFSPSITPDGTNQRTLDLSNIVNVMQVAHNLGIADITPLGESLLLSHPAFNLPGANQAGWGMGIQGSMMRRSPRGRPSRHQLMQIDPIRAKKELQFHAMLLTPHQIELIFVLCTLLSGRRKINVQERFAEAGLDTVLLQMFDRMSWGAPPSNRTGQPQHIHGPNCECDVESPLRVQYLRLIHNFYDRDFLGNENKLVMLSAAEKLFVAQERPDMAVETTLTAESGLLCKIVHTLLSEPAESLYKFWLSACVENFLRGCGRMGQTLVAQFGVIENVLKHIVTQDLDSDASMQTYFDLLGELVKTNHSVLARFDTILTEEEFARFRIIVMRNLIDSNVFVRSLFMTVEYVSFSYAAFEEDSIAYPHPTSGLSQLGYHMNSLGHFPQSTLERKKKTGKLGYLKDSWVQFEPVVLSKRAVAEADTHSSTPKSANSRSSRKINSAKFPALHGQGGSAKVDGSPNKSGVDHCEETQGTTSTALSSISSGVLGALKDIRKATKHFLSFGDQVGRVQPFCDEEEEQIQASAAEAARARSASSNIEGEGLTESEYYDCRTSPPATSPSSRMSSADAKKIQGILLAGSPSKSKQFRLAEESKENETEHSHTGGAESTQLGKALQVPDNLSLIGRFITEEKVNVMTRLMSTVSLGTINHENICCLNTVIFMFLLEHKRGCLAMTLEAIKQRANEELSAAHSGTSQDDALHIFLLTQSAEKAPTSPKKAVTSKRCCAKCAPPASDSLTSTDSANNRDDALLSGGFCMDCSIVANLAPFPPSSPSTSTSLRLQSLNVMDEPPSPPTDSSVGSAAHTPTPLADAPTGESATPSPTAVSRTGAEVICRNFRELLWYWQEYYLRRGRDRLSIEFSVHIPFQYWRSIVGLMCRDDGASTSLLSTPTSLPPSPYARPCPDRPETLPSDLNSVCNV